MPTKKGGDKPPETPKDPKISTGEEAPKESLEPAPHEVLELVTARRKLELCLQAQQVLKDENKRLRHQAQQDKLQQMEVFSYLNRELLEKSQALQTLERQVQSLDGNVSSQRATFDHKLIEEKRSARDLTTKLAREVYFQATGRMC